MDHTSNEYTMGGPTHMIEQGDTDMITVSSTDIGSQSIDNWISFPHNPHFQQNKSSLQLKYLHEWKPQYHLKYDTQSHQLLQTLTKSELNNLPQICQTPQTNMITRCSFDHRQFITTHDIQSLITNGNPTPDNIITLYLKMLSKHYNIPFLNTDFTL
jgi:hypothetical protein